MTKNEVTNSFIYHKWFEERPYFESKHDYILCNEYTNMLMCGYGDLFKFMDENNFILPYQVLLCCCINRDGYLKVFRLPTNYIPDWSINDMLKTIKEYCIENKLKFVSIYNTIYNYTWITEFLGDDLKYEYNDEGKVILFK